MKTKKQIQYQKWLEKNREHKRAYQKKYDAQRYAQKKDEINSKNKALYLKNKKARKIAAKKYYQKTKDQALLRAKKWALNNKKKVTSNKKRYVEKNPIKRKYSVYRSEAQKRGYSFCLSIKSFEEIITSDCHYCGISNSGGIDRVKNNVGYVKRNCVPCCGNCNRMKWAHSYEDFLKMICRIHKNLMV